jgi:hypothetical protein
MFARKFRTSILAISVGLLALGAHADASEIAKFEITLEGPEVPDIVKQAKVEVRVFDGQKSDAPAAMINLAAEAIDTDSLSFPMKVTVGVPKARLSGIEDPCVGVLISSGGNIIYWNDSRTSLNQRGVTTVRLAPAE